jgi:serine/threonine-protein phosphatase 2A regulatory subunit A
MQRETYFANFLQIAKAVDDEVVTRDLVPAFVKLLKDSEAEVRTAIAGQIPGFCKLVDRTTLLNDIMTTVEDLVSDTSQHVRAALGTQISGLAPILGKQEYVSLLFAAYLYLPLIGPLTTFFPCSSKCSRMNFPTFGFISFQSWS